MWCWLREIKSRRYSIVSVFAQIVIRDCWAEWLRVCFCQWQPCFSAVPGAAAAGMGGSKEGWRASRASWFQTVTWVSLNLSSCSNHSGRTWTFFFPTLCQAHSWVTALNGGCLPFLPQRKEPQGPEGHLWHILCALQSVCLWVSPPVHQPDHWRKHQWPSAWPRLV